MKRLAFFLILAVLASAWQFQKAENSSGNFTINGLVLDTNRQPVYGATVAVKGTQLAVATDANGKFALTTKDSCVVLLIKSPGYLDQKIRQACAGATLEIILVSKAGINSQDSIAAKREMKKNRRLEALTMASEKASSSGYPMAMAEEREYPDFNTEDYSAITENRFYAVTQNPLSTFSIDVDAASYSNMRRFLKNGQQPPRDAIRIEELVNYFEYDYSEPAGADPFSVNTEISACPWQPQHRLLHIGLQGKHIPMDDLPASNLVFLIDVSGSMDQPNKLPLLRSSFKLLVDQLRSQDKVAIVVYAGAAGTVLEPTSGDEKQKIKDAIGQLRAGGSTAGGAGIQLAYKIARENFIRNGNNRVILATDGDFNVGPSSDAELVRMIEHERESGIFLTVLGFGTGNYKDNKMQELADKGNGNHAYIDETGEARKVLVSEFGGTMFAIAKDVKIQIEFNPAKVAGYRLIGYENRVLDKEDFNDDRKDAGELGSGHTVTALYEIIPAGVRSEFLTSVDDLKYQHTRVDPQAASSSELVTVKLRYKKPDGDKSRLLEVPVIDKQRSLAQSSDNFRWAAAVAEFGMLLRESEFLGDATYAHCKRLAEGAKGSDTHGYRRELIEMIDLMKSLADPEVAGH